MMILDLLNLIFGLIVAILLAYYVRKYYHLVSWLKDQAPMTWETYNRLGK